jgi:sugar phosphate isomerase/epimerase
MRFGVCCSPDQAQAALSSGADYIEAAGGRIAADPEYRSALKDLPVEASNLFFPGGLALYEQADNALIHAREVFRHGAALGVRVAIIGSGATRKSTPEVPKDAANRRFVEIVGQIGAIASEFGIPAAPESLQREETDVGNDLGELAQALKGVGVGYTADSFHVLKEWDFDGREGGRTVPSSEFLSGQIPFLPLHVHFAPLTRVPPTAKDPMLQAFVRRLKSLGYDGRVSLECNWTDFESEIGPALEATRSLWA